MKRLALLRHAEASWELAGELDYERGLTEKGVDECTLVRELLTAHGIAPTLVLCSGARRARETLENVTQALPASAEIRFEDTLYNADAQSIFELLQDLPEGPRWVMIVGHNPSLHDFSVELAGGDEPIDELAGSFPKGAIAEFELSDAWSELASGAGRLLLFARPQDAPSIS